MPNDQAHDNLPPSIYTRLRESGIPYRRYDIDGPGEGLVRIEFDGATDGQINQAATICQEFGKTLQRPPITQGSAREVLGQLNAIVTNIDSATLAQTRVAIKVLAKAVRRLVRMAIDEADNQEDA